MDSSGQVIKNLVVLKDYIKGGGNSDLNSIFESNYIPSVRKDTVRKKTGRNERLVRQSNGGKERLL
jgi:hypothetical protein